MNRAILADYRLLGIEMPLFFRLINGSSNWITKSAMTHTRCVHVHPTLYQKIFSEATGNTISQNFVNQLKRRFKKNWLTYVDSMLFEDTLLLACQHVAIINDYTASTLLRAPKVLGDL